MDYTIEKCLTIDDYDASSDELRSRDWHTTVNVWYGSDSARKDMAYLDELAARVSQEYPSIGREEMVVDTVRPHESWHHVGKLGIWVSLPLEEVLRLKDTKALRCL